MSPFSACAAPVFEEPLASMARIDRLFPRRGSRRQDVVDLLNEATVEKVRRVLSGDLPPRKLVAFLRKACGRHGTALTRDAHRVLGDLFVGSGDLKGAVPHYRRAMREGASPFETLANLGATLGRLGRFEESLDCLRKAEELRKDDPRVLNNLGATLVRLGQIDEALGVLRKARRLRPDYVLPRVNEGLALHQAGNDESAVSTLREALALPAAPPEAVFLLGICLGGLERWREAARAFDDARDRGCSIPVLPLLRAYVLAKAARMWDAREALEAIESDPDLLDELTSDRAAEAMLEEVRGLIAAAPRLSDLVDSVKIDLPEDVDFADWDQLSRYLGTKD